MADVRSTGTKTTPAANAVAPEPPSQSSRVTMLSPSLLLLEIPADINTSLPVWQAVRAQKVGVTWTVNPYNIGVHLTPDAPKQNDSTDETTSSVAQTPSLSLHPPVNQQHGSSENICMFLTFFQNPSVVCSVTLSLPLLITSSQQGNPSGTFPNTEVPPTMQSSTGVPNELQAGSEGAEPLSFHTRSSQNVLICDDLLLGRTGIRFDLSKPDSGPPAANFSVDPLKEFSSWYPPVWCQTQEDYNLVDVQIGTQAYQTITKFFYKSLTKTSVDIISIQQVQNLFHWDKYQRQKAHMQKHNESKKPLEKHLFHGTTKEASESICRNNFDPRMDSVNGKSYGYGTYFATTSQLSDTYARVQGPVGVRHMFLTKVLVGRVCLGNQHYRRPPRYNSKTQQHALYDSCVDRKENPTMFVVFDSCQCYPYYLIKYKERF